MVRVWAQHNLSSHPQPSQAKKRLSKNLNRHAVRYQRYLQAQHTAVTGYCQASRREVGAQTHAAQARQKGTLYGQCSQEQSTEQRAAAGAEEAAHQHFARRARPQPARGAPPRGANATQPGCRAHTRGQPTTSKDHVRCWCCRVHVYYHHTGCRRRAACSLCCSTHSTRPTRLQPSPRISRQRCPRPLRLQRSHHQRRPSGTSDSGASCASRCRADGPRALFNAPPQTDAFANEYSYHYCNLR